MALGLNGLLGDFAPLHVDGLKEQDIGIVWEYIQITRKSIKGHVSFVIYSFTSSKVFCVLNGLLSVKQSEKQDLSL